LKRNIGYHAAIIAAAPNGLMRGANHASSSKPTKVGGAPKQTGLCDQKNKPQDAGNRIRICLDLAPNDPEARETEAQAASVRGLSSTESALRPEKLVGPLL
jgi:hypothetical protein